jgi:hypothetical protein
MRRKIVAWLIGKLLPKYHLSRNPPKGIKRARRLPKENDTPGKPGHLPDPAAVFKE